MAIEMRPSLTARYPNASVDVDLVGTAINGLFPNRAANAPLPSVWLEPATRSTHYQRTISPEGTLLAEPRMHFRYNNVYFEGGRIVSKSAVTVRVADTRAAPEAFWNRYSPDTPRPLAAEVSANRQIITALGVCVARNELSDSADPSVSRRYVRRVAGYSAGLLAAEIGLGLSPLPPATRNIAMGGAAALGLMGIGYEAYRAAGSFTPDRFDSFGILARAGEVAAFMPGPIFRTGE